MQLDGLVAVAEFGSRFEADLAASRLTKDGVDAMVQSDPAHQVAPHIVTQAGHRVLVAATDSDSAMTLLDQDHEPAAPAQLGLRRRPRWFRWLTYALAASMFGPMAYGLVQLLDDIIA